MIRGSLLLLCLIARASPTAAAETSDVLVKYSFDDESAQSGPDTFRVFQHSKGQVAVSRTYKLSGHGSIEIKDMRGDGDFPELQGYFPTRDHGQLFIHFGFMTTAPSEELNIALAGPGGFRLAADGIAFWLKVEEGVLRQVSDSIPKRLVRISPFVWYVVDVAYDIDRGTYDLLVDEEGPAKPVVALYAQKNAANNRGSKVDKFSFVGDVETDQSNVRFFVDDVVVSMDERILAPGFAAPGRRKLFVDAWHDAKAAAGQHIQCPRLENPQDLGLRHQGPPAQTGPADVESLLQTPSVPDAARHLAALRHFRTGCSALDRGKAREALESFDRANEIVGSRIVDLSRALALAVLGRHGEGDRVMERIALDWRGDPRYDIAWAMMGLAKGDVNRAEAILARAVSDGGNDLRLAEHYLLVLLWNGKPEQAHDYARRVVAWLKAAHHESGPWLELYGDTCLFLGRAQDALAAYTDSLGHHPDRESVYLKLSDVYFKLGDLKNERAYREKIYGTLYPN